LAAGALAVVADVVDLAVALVLAFFTGAARASEGAKIATIASDLNEKDIGVLLKNILKEEGLKVRGT
jgi:hypothetical protein